MSGFLDNLRTKVISSVYKQTPEEFGVKNIDDKIALGVLLWIVAEADSRFLPQEQEKIEEILTSRCKILKDEVSCVMETIKLAAQERIDLYRFTSEVSKDLPYQEKQSIIGILFRVACSDKELDDPEIEVIRKISDLFGLSHGDFIEAKINIKKELGLKTPVE